MIIYYNFIINCGHKHNIYASIEANNWDEAVDSLNSLYPGCTIIESDIQI